MSSLFGRREQAARSRVLAVRSAVRHDYVQLDEQWQAAVADALVRRSDLAADDALGRELHQLHQHGTELIEQATAAFLDADRWHDPDEIEGRAALEQAAARWESVHRQVGAAIAVLKRLQATTVDVTARQRWCAELLAGIDTRVEGARGAVASLADQRFATAELLTTIGEVVEGCRHGAAALEGGRVADAHRTLVRADEALRRITTLARTLPDRRRDLLAGHAALLQQLEASGHRVRQLTATVVAMRAAFTDSVWHSVADMPAQAAAEVQTGHTALDEAMREAAMTQQRFDEAAAALTRAQQAVAAVESMHAAVIALQRAVDAAIAAYPAAHAAASASIATVRAILDQHPGDVNPALHYGVGTAARVLAQAERMASTGRGDPFAALQLLEQVEDYTTRVRYSAQADKQRRDAHRSQVQGMLRQAHRDVARARANAGMGVSQRSKQARLALDHAQHAIAEAQAVLGVDPDRAHQLVSEALAIAQQHLPVQPRLPPY